MNGVRVANDGNTMTRTVTKTDMKGNTVTKEVRVAVRPGEQQYPIDISEPASHYQAIEVYTGDGGPMQFRSCAILLWTRGS